MGITASGGSLRRSATALLPPAALATPPPALATPPSSLGRFQQTRLQRRVVQAGGRLERWATNPWRRLSLLLSVLLLSFCVGGGLGAITGALSTIDQLSALICVLAIELAARLRGRLLRRRDRLALQLVDMARIGFLYGLVLDGFKLL